jgi:hypothetical protein
MTGTSFRRIQCMRMADEPDPAATPSDSTDEKSPPPSDDSYLLGASGVEEQVLAELARAEASINDPEEPDDESDGAVV